MLKIYKTAQLIRLLSDPEYSEDLLLLQRNLHVIRGFANSKFK